MQYGYFVLVRFVMHVIVAIGQIVLFLIEQMQNSSNEYGCKDLPKHVAEVLCRAWNELDASLLEPLLSDDFEYTFFRVFETMKGKDRYLEYISGKFETIRNGDRPVSAEVVYQDSVDKYVLVLNQGGNLSALEPTMDGNMLKSLWMRPPGLTLSAVFTTNKPTEFNTEDAPLNERNTDYSSSNKKDCDDNSFLEDKEWMDDFDDGFYKEMEECGKPQPLNAGVENCPFCGHRLKPVFWGEVTSEVMEMKKKGNIYIGEELYGRDTGADYQEKYGVTQFVQNEIDHPEYACGNCGRSYILNQ